MEFESIRKADVMSYQSKTAKDAAPEATRRVESAVTASEETKKTEKAEQPGKIQKFRKADETDAEEKTAPDILEEQNAEQGKFLKKAVNDMNRQMKNSEAIFGIHDKTNRVTIKIVDKTTKEIIKEYPPEQTLDMIAKVWEVAGILVDEKR